MEMVVETGDSSNSSHIGLCPTDTAVSCPRAFVHMLKSEFPNCKLIMLGQGWSL